MFKLTVKTHFGTHSVLIADENEALKRARLWAKHPIFIAATVQAVGTYSIAYAITLSNVERRAI